jgi:hypothetical protein
MHRVQDVTPGVAPELNPEMLRLAVELYHRDQLARASQNSEQLAEVARNIGVPIEYVEHASRRIQARRSARARRREWLTRAGFFGLGVVTALSLVSSITTAPAPPAIAPTASAPWEPAVPAPPEAPTPPGGLRPFGPGFMSGGQIREPEFPMPVIPDEFRRPGDVLPGR